MKHILAVILGVVTSATASLVLASGVAFTAGVVGHFLEAWPWLFSVSVGPCALSALGLSFAASRTRRSRWRLHISALLAAYIGVALAGSLGAIAVESAHRGVEHVNVSGYLTWCWIYAALILPLSYPLAMLLQRMIHRLHHVPNRAAANDGNRAPVLIASPRGRRCSMWVVRFRDVRDESRDRALGKSFGGPFGT
jgi:hypothetical protein